MASGSHVVFTNGRSGSNFVVDALNQHPELCNYGEVLGAYMPPMRLHERFGYGGSTIEEYLDYILSSRRHFEVAQVYSAVSRLRRGQRMRRKRWSDLTSIGMKDFAIRFAERGVENYLASRPAIKVISLHRENTLRRAVSLVSLRRTGIVAVHSSNAGSPRQGRQFEVDVEELVGQMKLLEEEKVEQLAVIDQLDSDRCFRLTYEELFASSAASQRLIGEVFAFLGVEPRRFEVNHQRIVPVDLRQTVVNYGELEQAVARSGFDRYLALP